MLGGMWDDPGPSGESTSSSLSEDCMLVKSVEVSSGQGGHVTVLRDVEQAGKDKMQR